MLPLSHGSLYIYILHAVGSLCDSSLEAVGNWTMRMTPADDWKQSESGWDELRGVGVYRVLLDTIRHSM